MLSYLLGASSCDTASPKGRDAQRAEDARQNRAFLMFSSLRLDWAVKGITLPRPNSLGTSVATGPPEIRVAARGRLDLPTAHMSTRHQL
jgi:hypothetical protein